MRTKLVVAIAFCLLAGGVIALAGRAALATISPTAHEADVNQDGIVNSIDLGLVARCFGRMSATDHRLCIDSSTMTPTPTFTPTATATPTSTPQPDFSAVFSPCAYGTLAAPASTVVHIGCTMASTSPIPFFGWQNVLTQQVPAMAGPVPAAPTCTSTGTVWSPFLIAGNPVCGDPGLALPWFPPTCRAIEFVLPGIQGPWGLLHVEIIGAGPFPTVVGFITVAPGVPPC